MAARGEYVKRIVLCADGTWNHPDQVDRGQSRPSNVAKIALALAPEANGVRQVLFYDKGVGTNWRQRLIGGAFGVGLNKNIGDIYKFLAAHYEPGDEVYLFGFSRGAYTVRSAAGLIRNAGLLKRQYLHRFTDCFALYRRRDSASHPMGIESTLFRKMYSYDIRIKFIGVWDTVGAYGIPLRGLRSVNRLLGLEFHDVQLSRFVDYAYQALAIDEKRGPFTPTLWIQHAEAGDQTLEQVWFTGVHTNVGGGYEDTGLSDTAFEWMRTKAERCGLAFDPVELDALTIKPRWDGELRNSKTGLYVLTRDFNRPIGAKGASAKEVVHDSAFVRYRDDPAYRPPELTRYIQAGTPGSRASRSP
jgi:uncharacterized protein (DUF2235 family)